MGSFIFQPWLMHIRYAMCISLAFIGLLLLGLNQAATTGQEIIHGTCQPVHGRRSWRYFAMEML